MRPLPQYPPEGLTNGSGEAILYLTKRLNNNQEGGGKLALQDTLRALSDPTRREILNLLKRGSLPAGELGKRFAMSGAAVSKHLAVLREAGLVRDRREGKYIFYELNASVLEEVLLWLKELKGEAQ